MTYGWHDLLGNIGVVLILATYLLLQLEKLSATSLLYSATNGLGALLILVSLIYQFNLSAFIIEAFWLLISIYGIVRYFSRNRSRLAARQNN
ncbi:MAG: hypothetical protein IIB68_12620 [Proteobacteria bacterium]|nr:hypothetical protein [Pseudomonadota bacterium]